MKGITWLWRHRQAKAYCRSNILQRKNILVDNVVQQFGVDPDVVHKICKRWVKAGSLQRLHNTPGADYYPIGPYGGHLRLPHPDGAKNPFLTEDGHLMPELAPTTARERKRT